MKSLRKSFYLTLMMLLTVAALNSACKLAPNLKPVDSQAAVAIIPTQTPLPQPPIATPTIPSIATPTPSPTVPPTSPPTATPLPTLAPTVTPSPTGATNAQAVVSLEKNKLPFIVFASDRGCDSATGQTGIYRVNPDGTNPTLLHPFAPGDWDVDVSPDGQRMLYSARDGDDIYLANIDGSDSLNLTQTPAQDEYWPRWSPDGQRILYEQYNGDSHDPLDTDFSDIYVMNTDGSHPVNLTRNQPGGMSRSQAWSPDGQHIIFVSQQDIYVMNTDGTNPINLTNTPDSSEMYPVWLPDGQRIAYFSEEANTGWGINIINIGGGSPARLAVVVPEHYSISLFSAFHWSPDGRRVAFLAEYNSTTSNDLPKPAIPGLFTANTNGSNVIQLTDLSLSIKGYGWSVDGQQLVFAAGPADELTGCDNQALYVVNADGSGLKRLTEANFANIDAIEWVSSKPITK